MSRSTTFSKKYGGGESSTSSAEASLYFHIPFCRTKCLYCDFYSLTQFHTLKHYLRALHREIKTATASAGSRFTSLYFGGGTPSLLDPADLSAIMAAVRRRFHIDERPEITLEANPGPLDFTVLLKTGFNRITFGVQSFQDAELEILGRIHNADEAADGLRAARLAGFPNIGLDLIIGIPGQSPHSWKRTLERALDLRPEHISIYFLTLEPAVPLARALERGELKRPAEEEERENYMRAKLELEGAGYEHYEIASFARPLFRSRHNSKTWDGAPYLGFGPSAHSFDGERRWWNVADLELYCLRMKNGDSPIGGSERLTPAARLLELIMLGLRRREGLSLARAGALLDGDFTRRIAPVVDVLGGVDEECEPFGHSRSGSLLARRDDALYLTASGLMTADDICARLAAAVT